MTQTVAPQGIPNHGPEILGVSTSLVTVSGITVAARILARRSYMAGNTTSLDDWLIVVAWFLALARSIVDTLLVLVYGYGKASADVSVRDSHQAGLLIWLSGLFYRLSALNVKLSVLMLYLRLFTLHGFNPRFRLLVLFSICAVLLVFGAFIFVAIFGCSPVDMFWNRSKKGWCINFLPFYYVHIGMEVFLDIWVMLLPVEIIGELNLPRKTRWGLVVLFGLGLLSTAAKIPVILAISEAGQYAYLGWTTIDAKTWISVELNLLIICTCLPILRNPFRILATHMFGTTADTSDHHGLEPWENGNT